MEVHGKIFCFAYTQFSSQPVAMALNRTDGKIHFFGNLPGIVPSLQIAANSELGRAQVWECYGQCLDKRPLTLGEFRKEIDPCIFRTHS